MKIILKSKGFSDGKVGLEGKKSKTMLIVTIIICRSEWELGQRCNA